MGAKKEQEEARQKAGSMADVDVYFRKLHKVIADYRKLVAKLEVSAHTSGQAPKDRGAPTAVWSPHGPRTPTRPLLTRHTLSAD
jgi:hypothetical protein